MTGAPDPLEFRDKAVVVTGGSAGIGLAIALAFARAGAGVVVAGRDLAAAERAAAGIARETGGAIGRLDAAAGDHHLRAALREGLGDGASDACAPSGDDDDLLVEFAGRVAADGHGAVSAGVGLGYCAGAAGAGRSSCARSLRDGRRRSQATSSVTCGGSTSNLRI